MQDIIDEVLKELQYLDPYLRQFTKYLKGDNILTIGENYVDNKLKLMGYNTLNTDNNIDALDTKYDGIILFNNQDKINLIPKTFSSIYNITKENGYLLLVIRNSKNGPILSQEYLDIVMNPYFEYTEELSSYENLKFYIYAKNTIK